MRSRKPPSRSAGAKRGDDVGKRREVDAAAGLDRLDAECCRQMRLAGARGAKDVNHLVTVDELQLGEGQNAVSVERRLEGEVEAGECLDGGQPGHHQSRLDAPALAEGEFFGEQGIDGFQSRDLAVFELADDLIEDLQRWGHLQADQGAADPLEGGRGALDGDGHDRSPSPARRRPTAS